MNTRQDALNRLKGIVSSTPSQWHDDVKQRAEEKSWKKRSQAVALTVLRTLRAKEMSQSELAKQLGVSPQLVNKWVKGKENFTFETVARLEDALGIQLMQITGISKQSTGLGRYIRAKKSHELTEIVSTESKVVPMNREYDNVPDEQYDTAS